jgi:hypothetical protein
LGPEPLQNSLFKEPGRRGFSSSTRGIHRKLVNQLVRWEEWLPEVILSHEVARMIAGVDFPVTVGAQELTLLELCLNSLPAHRSRDDQVLFFWVQVVEFQCSWAQVISAKTAFAPKVGNSPFFQLQAFLGRDEVPEPFFVHGSRHHPLRCIEGKNHMDPKFLDYWKITTPDGEKTYEYNPVSEWAEAPTSSVLERAEGEDDPDLWHWVELEIKE